MQPKDTFTPVIIKENLPSALVGIGLRSQHYEEIMRTKPKIGWFEVHSENYFGEGGKPRHYLQKLRKDYPFSFHGVGLSLGSADRIQKAHLLRLKNLINMFSPCLVSEHLSWSVVEDIYVNDLLPLPYTEDSLALIIDRINQVQDTLNCQILIENISSYLQFADSIIPEYEFINELAQRTHCGILLDINNLYVSSHNHGWDMDIYLSCLSKNHVKEIHLAGFIANNIDEKTILIDAHSKPIAAPVWDLYAKAVQLFGPVPTLIEWDQDIPELFILQKEAEKAGKVLEKYL